MTAVEKLLVTLPGAKANGHGWMARCPAHDDKTPSLSVSEGDDGRALLHCHAGCEVEAIVSELGLTMRDLMPEGESSRKRATAPKAQPVPFATELLAVEQLERRHGQRSAMWSYHDAKGMPVGAVVRWDRQDGRKDIRPVSRNGTGWLLCGMPAPRPLYGLPDLADASRVYITEGEKAADAVRALGLSATTSAHGSKSAGKTDWAPLAGMECVILPDNDPAGGQYADAVMGLLAKLSSRPTIKRVELPALPDHGDVVEYIEARRTAGLDDGAIHDKLEGLANAAPLAEYPQQPAEQQRRGAIVERYRPFPRSALPEPVQSFVAKYAEAIGCDAAYVALPLLSALAAAIGNARRIQLKRGWTEPAILWTVIVGESGTLKTPAFKAAMAALRQRQGDALKCYNDAREAYEPELLQYEKRLQNWKRDKVYHSRPPEKPQTPQAVRHIVSDATVESMAPILLANPRGVLLGRDELSGWIGSFDRYAGGKGADAAHWLSMHNGESILVDRKTGDRRTIHVPSAAVSVAGGVQPGILDRVLGCEHRESGLMARLLLVMPPRLARRWTDAEVPASVEVSMRLIFDRLFELEPDGGDDGSPRPRDLALTPEALGAWIRFYNAHGEEQVDLTGDLSAAWSKLEGYAARLALIVHAVRWAADDPTLSDPDHIDEVSIDAGVVLSRWFGHEARRVYAALTESGHGRELRQLAEQIQRLGGVVSIRDWQRRRSHETASDAEAELAELADAGYGRLKVPLQTGRGRPSKRFTLASDKTDTDKNRADSPESVFLSVSEVPEGFGGAWGEI